MQRNSDQNVQATKIQIKTHLMLSNINNIYM